MLMNLTYLAVTTLAKQGSRRPKRRLPTALGRPCGRESNNWSIVEYLRIDVDSLFLRDDRYKGLRTWRDDGKCID